MHGCIYKGVACSTPSPIKHITVIKPYNWRQYNWIQCKTVLY